MPDDDLRALERRWRATRDPQDEAAFHAARVRAGVQHPSRLALVGALGLRGDATVGAERPRWPEAPTAWGRLYQIATSLIAPDAEARARALVALAGPAIDALSRARAEAEGAARDDLALAEDDLAVAAGLLVRKVRTGERPRAEQPAVDGLVAAQRFPPWFGFTRDVALTVYAELEESPAAATIFVSRLWPITAEDAERRFGEESDTWAQAVHAALQRALPPWALGQDDPLDAPDPRLPPGAELERRLREVHARTTALHQRRRAW